MRSRSIVAAAILTGAITVALAGCTPPRDGDDALVGTPTSVTGQPTTAPTVAPTSTPPVPDPTSTPSKTDADGRGIVVPLVTYSGYDGSTSVVEVSAFVPGIVEADGLCTLTLTRGDESLEAEQQAQPDASSTQCGSIFIQLPSNANGNWTAVINYVSDSSAGKSSSVSIKVG